MTIKELIAKLSEYDGETIVKVQYRDEGGDYDGSDEQSYLYLDDDGALLL